MPEGTVCVRIWSGEVIREPNATSCFFSSTHYMLGPLLGTLSHRTHLTLTPSLQAGSDTITSWGTDGETEAQRDFCDLLKVT